MEPGTNETVQGSQVEVEVMVMDVVMICRVCLWKYVGKMQEIVDYLHL